MDYDAEMNYVELVSSYGLMVEYDIEMSNVKVI